MKATKLTPAIKEWIRTEFGSYCYDNHNSEHYFHYPNFDNNKGFKDGIHVLNKVLPDYNIVSEQEFLDEFSKREPKRGEMKIVGDKENTLLERIFLNYTEGAMFPYQTVASGYEKEFKNNEPFCTTLWIQCKRIEVKKVTSKHYLTLLLNEFKARELSPEDLESTLKHYAELYHQEQKK